MNLVTLDVDVEALKKSVTEVNKDIQGLTEQQKLLKKSSIDLGIEVQKKTAIMQKAEKSNKTNSASYNKLRQEVEAFKKVQKLSNRERSKQLTETKAKLQAKRKEERLAMNMVVAYTEKEQKRLEMVKQTDGSIDQISSALAKNRALYRSLTPEQRANKDIGQELLKVINQQDQEYKKLNNEMGVTQVNVGNYKEEMKKALSESLNFQDVLNSLLGHFGFLSPLLVTVKNKFLAYAQAQWKTATSTQGVKKAMQVLKTTLLSNPITALIVGIGALVVGMAKGIKEIFKYNNAVRKQNKEVEQLANTTGKATDQLRINAQALTDTFGGDFKDNVKELNSLMTDFGLSSDEAFNIYSEGLAKGGASNDEFKDSIKEYGSLFAQNGYSAQEFINLLNAGIDLDIYNDKLPDAIKEAGLSLSEQTKATKDALINAFGESFSDDILSRVKNGQISIKDALQEISAKAKDSQLNQQQLAQLTADVFKGAGEDAGGALKIFEAINVSQKENSKGLTDIQKHTKELALLNKELAEEKDSAMKSDSVIKLQRAFETFWVKTKIIWYKFIGTLTNGIQTINKVTGASKFFISAFKTIVN